MLFRFDLGSEVSPGELSQSVVDMSLVTDVALRWSAARAESEARDEITRLAAYDPDQLRERVREQDLQVVDALREAHRLWDELEGAPPDIWVYEWRRLFRRRYGKLGREAAYAFPWFAPIDLQGFAPALFADLVAQEAGRRRPEPVRVESLRYENPVEWILVGAGILLGTGGIAKLIEIGRDWSTTRRTNRAAADQAEAKARRAWADASKAEQEAELARIVVERLRGGEVGATQNLIDLLDEREVRAALWRLGSASAAIEELPELPGDTGDAAG
jgi:hypothetical protein